MPTAFMEYLKKPVDLKSKKTMVAVIGSLILLIALPLTVIGTLQLREGTPRLTTRAETEVPPLGEMGFPRISNVNAVEPKNLKYMVTSIGCTDTSATKVKNLRATEPSI